MTTIPALSLRQAGPADWSAIETLLLAHGLPTQGAREHLAHFLLAHQGGELVACAGIERYGDLGLLRSVAVAPGLLRQGIGGSLLATLLTQARRRGLHRLYLLTTTAAAYFERLGFQRLPRAELPAALQASAELRGACPASATAMALSLIEAGSMDDKLPVAVLGAGPVGLAAAAHLLERGLRPLILEAGGSVGAHLLDYGHVRLFSPWRFNLDAAMARQLRAAGGWQAPPEEALPLAREVVEQVLRPYAALPAVAAALRLSTRVTAISREGFDKVKTAGREQAPFLIRARQADGGEIELRARAVIDATGTWGQPNPAGANGLPAPGESALAARRIAYGIPDVLGAARERYAGHRTLVVGAGHSAANALLDLATLAEQVPGTRLAWATRSPAPERAFGGGARDALPARGRLGSALRALRRDGRLEFFGGLRITALREAADGSVTVQGQDLTLDGFDQLIVATGQRPDLGLTRELRLKLDPWLESTEALGPLIDPNLHSCGTVRPHGHRELAHPEPGFYTLGVKSYGRAPTFLMATGFEQARSVAAALAGDLAAADRVELELPQTGVCGIGIPVQPAAGAAATRSACCG